MRLVNTFFRVGFSYDMAKPILANLPVPVSTGAVGSKAVEAARRLLLELGVLGVLGRSIGVENPGRVDEGRLRGGV